MRESVASLVSLPSDPTPSETARRWRRVLARPVGAAVLAGGWVAVSATGSPVYWPSQPRFLAWIALLLVSFGGWGRLATALFRAEALGGGFVRVTLGMAALLAVAGVLLAAHVLAFPVLIGLVLIGATIQLAALAGAGARLWDARGRWSARLADFLGAGDVGYLVAAALVLLFASLRMIGSAKLTLSWWDADDTPAYWAFIRELTQRGSFDQAFSFRRMVAYGGQTVLQAIFGLGLPIRSLNVFDDGICPLLLSGILLQVGRRQWLAIAAALLVAVTPTAALNSASNFSGSLFFVLLYLTLRFASDTDARRGGALTGLAAAGLCTLRHSYIPGCAALLAAAALVHLGSPGGQARDVPDVRPWRRRLGFAAGAGVAFAAALAPWAIASLIASRTPLFPLFHGTYRGGGVDMGVGDLTWLDGLQAILQEKPPMAELIFFFMAILALGSRMSRAALAPVALGTLVSTIALAKAAPHNPNDDVRYLAAPWVGLVVAFYCEAVARAPRGRRRDQLFLAAVATVTIAVQLAPVLQPGLAAFLANARIRKHWPAWDGESTVRRAALDLQDHIPAGATVLAACDQAYHFNFRRNKILLADLPTVASPVLLPGERATPEQYEAAAAALRRRGIDYLMFSDPDRSHTMYSAARWESFRNDGYRTHEVLVPRFAAWFGFEKYLEAHRPTVATSGVDKIVSLR
jgi:hypothetical protein